MSHVFPSVAIIIPTYNRASLVSRAIGSVLSQRGLRAQIIVVDDGSKDDTPRVLEEYADDDTVLVVRHATNRGVASAKNSGLDHVPPDVDLVGILDSDDRLEPGALEALVGGFRPPEGDQWSQVFGWCRDASTGLPTGLMIHREGRVTYDDALAGRFSGEFWQLARVSLIGDRRFDPRARGGEAVIWWSLLKAQPAWLIPDVVRVYDTAGEDRVSRLDYRPAGARGTMWVYRAGMRAYGLDMRRTHPARYAEQAAELAKWAALAGEQGVAGAAARSGWRAHPSRRGALAILMAFTPPAALRLIAGLWSARRRRVAASATEGAPGS